MTAPAELKFRPLPAEQSARELEESLLVKWKEERLVERALADKPGAPSFVFYDGPPTANGKPGIHHVFARTTKDLFARHRAMHGYWVPRKAGWDTHGLPVEIEVEKRLGIKGKQEIEALGVEKFNALCRESVWTYKGEWERLVERIAHWLDYSDPYITYSKEYVESEWWALKTLHQKGLLTRGHKILPYCPRCGTALSSHEVAQGYEDVEDPSVYIALDLVDDAPVSPVRASVDGPGAQAAERADLAPAPANGRRRLIVWTTTPWTLVSNVALAVNPELTYAELRKKRGSDFTVILAEPRVPGVLGADWADRWDVVGTMTGAQLAGRKYRRPLDWLPYPDIGASEVIVAESFVSADDGSGIVHMAPAFGADDYAAGQRHGLAFLQPVNARGEFPNDLPLVGGQFVKHADAAIIEELERRDVLWKASRFVHAYPHCWRCRTPLLYYARSSWFVKTTAVKDRMLARNAQVDWHPPETGAGRFGEWLTNNVDWAISRDRFWGTPLPVWVNDENPDELEVIGSYEELFARVGTPMPADFDPHKPGVDQYTWPSPTGKGTMRRVPEVIDTWFDSGSMPFAQHHYPFENREAVERQFPADFIAEGVDQTRGWFYSLLAIATGLGDALPNNGGDKASPYRAVVVNDLVLDAQGRKMSKSRGNVVDPWQVINTHGADAVRLFLVAAGQVWKPRAFDERAIRETIGGFLLTLRNVYRFFADLANFGWAPSAADPAPASRPVIDRWMLSRLAAVEADVDQSLQDFDATNAAQLLITFVVEDVSKWYVRLTRDRFYATDTDDARAAFATLHETLVVTCRLLAPFAPFLSDWLHRELTGDTVHLARYTRADVPRDVTLELAMEEARTLVRLGRAARETVGIGVRQPLGRMVCVAPALPHHLEDALLPYVAQELNIKRVETARSADALVTLEAKGNFRTLGKKFGKATPDAAAQIAALSSDQLRAFERGEVLELTAGGATVALAAEDVLIQRRATGAFVVQEDGGRFAAIDPEVTDALRSEGYARELLSRVQRLRKESGLALSDRIRLAVQGDAPLADAARTHGGWIAAETLAVDYLVGELPTGPDVFTAQVELDGVTGAIAITRTA
ncbi:MAG: isoleucine--tRNA ligase [Gemmatimonadaceae bacterium]|nr:isoleucine--tRNA ligase [Gemmatimonadaceae bacterium]